LGSVKTNINPDDNVVELNVVNENSIEIGKLRIKATLDGDND